MGMQKLVALHLDKAKPIFYSPMHYHSDDSTANPKKWLAVLAGNKFFFLPNSAHNCFCLALTASLTTTKSN